MAFPIRAILPALNKIHAQGKQLYLRQTGLGVQHQAISAEEHALEKVQESSIKGFSILA